MSDKKQGDSKSTGNFESFVERLVISSDRYKYIMNHQTQIVMTKEEIEAGYHFCPEWDYLLIGLGMPESECCTCEVI